jgi:hypothetical protein
MKQDNTPALNLSIAQARARIGVGNTKFWELVALGEITVRKIGRRSFVLEEDIDRFLRSRPVLQMARAEKKL